MGFCAIFQAELHFVTVSHAPNAHYPRNATQARTHILQHSRESNNLL